jgi:two-component system response regulator RstA
VDSKNRTKKKILIVEDNAFWASILKGYIESNSDYSVFLEGNGKTATRRIIEETPDLVVLDINLPGLDGLSICRKIRPQYQAPILMLSAMGSEVDQVIGLDMGADDYMAKPASPQLILAKMKAMLRRRNGAPGKPDAQSSDAIRRIRCGQLLIDTDNRTVFVNKQNIPLTSYEFDLLWCLAEQAGHPITRQKLFLALRGIEWNGVDRSMDILIVQLRKKLGDNARNPQMIKSVRGCGYLLAKDAHLPEPPTYAKTSATCS